MTTKRKGKRATRDPKGRCGTQPGYQAHFRRGEKPCKACKTANTEYQRLRRQGKHRTGVRPTDVIQDQRRGADGKPVMDHSRKAALALPPAGKALTTPTATTPRRAPAPAQDSPPVSPAPAPAPAQAQDSPPVYPDPDPAPAPAPAQDSSPLSPEELADRIVEYAAKNGIQLLPWQKDLLRNSLAQRQASAPVPQEELEPVESPPEAPAFLRAQGRKFWDRVVADFDLNPSGLVLLGEACRTVDRLERMAAALSSRSTLWFEVEESLEEAGAGEGPTFNVVVNGMVGEARQLQAALRATLKELGITEVTPRATEDAPRESLTDELKRKRQERLARAAAALEAEEG